MSFARNTRKYNISAWEDSMKNNNKKLKDMCRDIPQSFWENTSYAIILMMFMLLIIDSLSLQIRSFDFYIIELIDGYYFVGRIAVAFVVFKSVIWLYVNGFKGLKSYFKKNLYEVILIALLLWSVVATVFSVNPQRSLMGSGMRHAGLRSYVIFAALYICGKSVISVKNRRILFWTLAVTSLVQDISIIMKFLGYYGSIDACFWNSNYCGYFLTMSTMAMAAMLAYEKNKYVKLILAVIYPLNLFCLIYNNTFGSYVAVLAGLIFLVIVTLAGRNGKKYMAGICMVIILFVITNIYAEYETGYISQNFNITGSDIKNISEKDEKFMDAGTGRMRIWIDGINCALDNPITGVGPDNKDIVGKEAWQAHNELIQIAAEQGFVGLALYMTALILLCIRKVKNIKNISPETSVSSCIMFTYLVSSLFGNMIFNPAMFYYVFMGNLSIED